MMQRFFLPPAAFQGNRVFFPENITRQISQVLRLRPGDEVVVLDNSGWEYRAVLQIVSARTAEAEISLKTLNAREPALQLTLYQCLLKSDHFEWVLQKGTELGVSKFFPIISERTVLTTPEAVKEGKLERWRRILTEAAEQSGRGRLPVLGEVTRLQTALDGIDPTALNLIPWEEQEGPGLSPLLELKMGQGRIQVANLWIGPEGGFSRGEIHAAENRGVIPVTLGKRILRAETAAVTAVALVLAAAGELD